MIEIPATPAITPAKTEALRALLAGGAKRIVITTHHKPDADALGSSLALWQYLRALGHDCTVITPTDFPTFLDWMEGRSHVILYTDKPMVAQAKALLADADLIFCLDFNALSRINEMGALVAASPAKKVMVDHHLEPEPFADLAFSDTGAAATAELIYLLLLALGDEDAITPSIADCLYAGLMTDTGSFRHPSTTRRVHLIIAQLVGLGAQNVRVHRLIYDTMSEARLRFLGYAISDKLTVLPGYRTAYIAITAEELKRFAIGTGDTEGIVNFALAIESVVFAAIIIDRTEAVKMSFRSAGGFDCNTFARTHFDGGGHFNAAGGKTQTTLEETVAKFVSLLPAYADELAQVVKA